MSALFVFVAALVTALATGLGALPFLLVHRPGRLWLGLANALASGFMIGASVGLAYEGAGCGPGRVVLGSTCRRNLHRADEKLSRARPRAPPRSTPRRRCASRAPDRRRDVARELLPEAFREADPATVATAVLSAAAMIAFQLIVL